MQGNRLEKGSVGLSKNREKSLFFDLRTSGKHAMLNFKEMQFPAYPLSIPYSAELTAASKLPVDDSMVMHRVVGFMPLLDQIFCKYKRAVGNIWRVEQIYIEVDGELKYLHRAVNRARCQNGTHDQVPRYKSGAKKAAIEQSGKDRVESIAARLAKYLKDVADHDHRAVDRAAVPMPGVKSFRSAGKILAAADSMHMICNAQPRGRGVDTMSTADQFHALNGSPHPSCTSRSLLSLPLFFRRCHKTP